jgi:HK97 family phage major capsid protein
MEIQSFLEQTAKGPIALADLTSIAANRAAFGDDIVAAFTTQVQLRSTQAQGVLATAEQAGRDSLLASEQRSYDTAIRERDSILSLQRQVEQRTEARSHVPVTQTSAAIHTKRGGEGTFLGLELRELVGGSGAGGYITPPEHSGSFFDRLAEESVALRSGLRVITTDRDTLKVPLVQSDPSADWTSEGSEITDSDPDLDEVTATPRKLAARVIVSNELIADSNPSVVSLLEMQLIRALSLELDRAIFKGSGTPPEITGFDNVSGKLTDGSFSLTNLDDFADAIALLEANNARATAIVLHPTTWGTLTKVKEASGSAKPVMQDSAGSTAQGVQRSIYGVPVYASSQLHSGSPLAPDKVYVYDAPQIVLVRRQEIRVEIDRSRLFHKDQSEIRAILRADLVVPNPKALFVGTL